MNTTELGRLIDSVDTNTLKEFSRMLTTAIEQRDNERKRVKKQELTSKLLSIIEEIQKEDFNIIYDVDTGMDDEDSRFIIESDSIVEIELRQGSNPLCSFRCNTSKSHLLNKLLT